MGDWRQVDAVLQAAVRDGRIAGLTAAAADANGVTYQGAFGVREAGRPEAMTADSVFRIASMTKAVTTVAAMQMVEQGRLALDAPARDVLPFLAETQVLDGFDAAGQPVLRAPKGEITLRRLLTHTAGFVYETWNADMRRFSEQTGLPTARTGKLAALRAPLAFDPGTRWEYGINIDVAGKMVEAASGLDLEAYTQAHICGPLGMVDTSYEPRDAWDERMTTVHARQADGSLAPIASPPGLSGPREFYPGGGGLFSTTPDYMRLLRALMNSGELDGVRILRPETVSMMAENHIGALEVGPLPSLMPALSNPVELFPGMVKKWGLSFLINTEAVPGGRSAGSLAWAGLNNSYYWLDPKRKVAGVLMTQTLPFADPTVLGTLDAFERAVYVAIG